MNIALRCVMFVRMELKNALLLLFVKHPVAGQTKTRLAKGIGHEQALAVYRELLQKLKAEAESVGCHVAVFYGNSMPKDDLWAETGWPRLMQKGEDLGERMYRAFVWAAEQGYRRTILVGSDIPGVDTNLLRTGFEALASHQVILGPAQDGGYYLIGMQTPRKDLFTEISWSTDAVLDETLKKVEAAGLSFFRTPLLNDIDTVEDLSGTFLERYLPESYLPTSSD